jgi:3-hydroxybutyryl-CoA dehydrogenase
MSMTVGILGAGRMGRGMALHYALTGHPSILVDLKPRSTDEFNAYTAEIRAELLADLQFLSSRNLLPGCDVEKLLEVITVVQRAPSEPLLAGCEVVFEGVPEVMEAKAEAFEFASGCIAENALLASTSSTFAVGDLAAMVTRPERFMNAHWLNPAHLLPLVEIARGEKTSEEALARMKASLESVGKIPVVCNDRPGYIVPRLQCLIMNEAARMVEEGVASAEDIDRAILTGFGPRYASLGVLEFIDWGGGDITYYASRYMQEKIHPRFESPEIIRTNMESQRRGLRDGVGFYDYRDRDVGKYREQKLTEFIELLSLRGLLPNWPGNKADE